MTDRIDALLALSHDRGRDHFLSVGPRPDGPLSGTWAGESIPELLGDLLDEIEMLDPDFDAASEVCEEFERGFCDAESAAE